MKKAQKKGFGAQDFNKQLAKFGASKMGKYTSPDMQTINTGSQIAANRFQAGVNIPNEYDDKADFYARLGKIAGDKPSIASGFFSGLESATRGKANAERRGMQEKYDETMAWLADQNQRIMERIEEKQKEEALSQKYLPEVLAYARAAKNLDPQSQKFTLQSLMDRFNRDGGTDYQIASVDSTDPLMLMVTSPSGQGQVVPLDLRSLFAGQDQIQQQLATFNPEYQQQLQAQRQQQEFENNLEMRKVDIQQQGIPLNREKLEQTTRRNDIMEQTLEERKRGQNIKLNEKIGPRIKADRQFIERAPKLEKIVRDDPELFQSATRAIWDSQNKGDPSIISEYMKSINAKLNPERAKNVSILVKGINQMVLDVVDGFARPNMYVDMKGGKAVPNLDMPAEGFLDVLKDMSAEKRFNLNQNLNLLKHLEATGEDGGSLYGIYDEGVNGMPANDGKTVKILRHDTGKEIMVTPENAKIAVKKGIGEIVK